MASDDVKENLKIYAAIFGGLTIGSTGYLLYVRNYELDFANTLVIIGAITTSSLAIAVNFV